MSRRAAATDAMLCTAGVDVDRDQVVELLHDSAGAGAGRCGDGLIATDGRVDPDDHLRTITSWLRELSRLSSWRRRGRA